MSKKKDYFSNSKISSFLIEEVITSSPISLFVWLIGLFILLISVLSFILIFVGYYFFAKSAGMEALLIATTNFVIYTLVLIGGGPSFLLDPSEKKKDVEMDARSFLIQNIWQDQKIIIRDMGIRSRYNFFGKFWLVRFESESGETAIIKVSFGKGGKNIGEYA